MGNGASVDSKSIADIRSRTNYTDSELRGLLDEFNRVAGSQTDDGVVDIDEFAAILNAKPDDEKVQKLFSLFDSNHDGFVSSLSRLIHLFHVFQDT